MVQEGLTVMDARRDSTDAKGFPLRVLVAKPGLDGHDRGAKVVARALRDAGMEVIYTGIRQTPDQIAEAALHEDVEAIGLSIHSGAHLELFPRILEALRARGIGDIPIYAGGIIPDADIPTVRAMGVRGVYGPGTSLDAIVQAVREGASAERATRGL
jgi:methylmalonyl-CoA mutase C-terminal domain/subunit